MPMNAADYPNNWFEISKAIKDRAKNRCEQCGMIAGGLYWNGARFVAVVLTTAHLGIDKPDGSPGSKADTMDCRPENLKALCAKCHLAFDANDHVKTRARNAQTKKEILGQQRLF